MFGNFKISYLVCLFLMLVSTMAQSQVLIQEGGRPVEGQVIHRNRTTYNAGDYSTTEQLRSDRRVGVGLGFAGKLGLAGANIELNFTPQNSFLIGFGAGTVFESIAVDWKRTFGGNYFSGYVSAGYARWYNSSRIDGGVQRSMPVVLMDYLRNSEVQSGQFDLNFITPTLGLHYHQLTGPYRGTALYAEVVLLTELRDLRVNPIGATGITYYF